MKISNNWRLFLAMVLIFFGGLSLSGGYDSGGFLFWIILAALVFPYSLLSGKEQKPVVSSEEKKKPNGYKILFVEDDKDYLWILRQLFLEKGWEVFYLLDAGGNFVEKVINIKPDLISMNILMPNRDGISALKLLRADDRTKKIPVSLLTNISDAEHISMAFNLVVDDYIVKSDLKIEDIEARYAKFLKDKKDYKNGENNVNPVTGSSERGVFVLVKKLPSGADDYVTFRDNNIITNIGRSIGKYDLAVFNEILFANWYLVNLREDLKRQGASDNLSPNDKFFILQILDQTQWDFVRNSILNSGDTTAVLNPCIAKDHRCPVYRFRLEDETDFNNMKEWFSKAPNKHYTIKGSEKGGLLLFEKPTVDENGEFRFTYTDAVSTPLGKKVVSLLPNVPLKPILEEINNEFKPRADQKGIYLKLELPATPLLITADRQKLKAAISNIIDHTVKSTQKGGVTVKVYEKGDKVMIEVKDTGIGLPPQFGDILEKRGEILNKVVAKIGVGLYLSGRIIQSHNGKIWAEQNGEGRGVVFNIELPLH